MDTAGGVGVLSALAFSGLYLIVGKPEINVVFISLSACLSGFLVFNLPKASIIMGGVGSAMLGDFFAGASIHFYLINDHKVNSFIFLSSVKIYGEKPGFYNENDIPMPNDIYGKSIKDDGVQAVTIARRDQEILIVTECGTLCRQAVGKISTQRREAQGVRIVKCDDKDYVIAISAVDNQEDDTENKII